MFTSPVPFTLKGVLKKLPAAEHPSVLQASQHQETHPELVGSLLFSKRRDEQTHTQFLSENLKENDILEDLGIYDWIIHTENTKFQQLKCNFTHEEAQE